jgi:hypothetical protein
LDFDTSKSNGRRESRHRPGGIPDFSTGTRASSSKTTPEDGDFRIPAGSRKAALVHLALEAWRKGLLDPKELGEVRGRDVDEAGLQRALYRSSMGEIEEQVKSRKFCSFLQDIISAYRSMSTAPCASRSWQRCCSSSSCMSR